MAEIGLIDDPHTKRVLCNKCHGQRNDYGYPDTGKHSFHIENLRYDNQNSSKIKNDSFEDVAFTDPNPLDDVSVSGERTSWDLCDECHHTSAPYTQLTRKIECDTCHTVGPVLPFFDEPDNVLHINGETRVSFMDTTAQYDDTSKSCSGLDSCHTSSATDNISWGRAGRTPKRIKEDFFREVCLDCHLNLDNIEQKDKDEIFLSRTIEDTCDQCHGDGEEAEVQVRHPVNVEVSDEFEQEVAKAFSFEDTNIMTCVTCHAPHGEICQSCHSLNDETINTNKNIDKVFGGLVYDPMNKGVRASVISRSLIRRGNVYLRTSEPLEYDYYGHSFLYDELRQLRDTFCIGCHELGLSAVVKGRNLHLNFQCADCHTKIPYNKRICYKKGSVPGDFYPMVEFENKVALRNDVNVMCSACHLKRHFHVPKKQEIIKENLPSDLPLSPWKELTCATCHDPHVKYGDTGLIFRRAGDKGKGLCESCHTKQDKFKNTNPHNNKNRCFYCHLTEPYQQGRATSEEEEVLARTYISRCEVCHNDWKNTHPINVPPYRNNELGLPLNRQGLMTCGSCHDYHNPEELIIPKLSADGKASYFCNECHKD